MIPTSCSGRAGFVISRRIYLVGVLELPASKRKFLESRNIAPIDLSPLVSEGTRDEREAAATHQFLKYLENAKPKPPYDWTPSSYSSYTFAPKTEEEHRRELTDPGYGASLLDKAAENWRVDRETYPGW